MIMNGKIKKGYRNLLLNEGSFYVICQGFKKENNLNNHHCCSFDFCRNSRGKMGVGFADTIPTIPLVTTITPNVVPVNAETHTYVLTGTDFIGVEYTTLRFIEPDGTIHENIVPEFVYDCVIDTYSCNTLDVIFLNAWFQNPGTAQIWVINHDGVDPMEISGPYYIEIVTIPSYLYLPIIMKN